jgi:DNA-binding transcriptional LysR family regulator
VELGTGEAVIAAVEGGLGIAMVSGYVAEKALALGTIARIDLAETLRGRPFYAVTPARTLTRAASAFLDYVRVTLARSNDPVAAGAGSR